MNPVCIFCKKNEIDGEQHKLTDEHVIPQVLGGWIALPVVCKECNNTIGHDVESKLKKNAYIVAALDKLKIHSPDKAYKHAKFEMNLDDKHTVRAKITPAGRHEIVPTKQNDNSLIVSEKDGKEIL